MTTMKKYLFMAVVAIAVLSSCSSDNDFEQTPIGKGGLVFTATMEGSDATRATYDTTDKCASWEMGDTISINGKIYSAKSDGTTTTFKADGDDATGGTYKAYFPTSLYNKGNPTLPVTQTYTAGKFDMPMYAESTTTELAFKNLCAVLAIKITSADIDTLKSIKVVSDKKMNGTFTVTDDKAVVGEDGINAVVLKSPEVLTLTEEGTVIYIAIPAQEYLYLNIFLSSDGNNYTQAMATKKATGIGTIARSKIFNIDYKKNATKLWKGNILIADSNIGDNPAKDYLYAWGGNQVKKNDHNTGDITLTGDDDTATKFWGANWRMPTKEEFDTLISKCTGSYISDAGGIQCTGTGDYAGNSIFLPGAGYNWNDDYGGYSHYGEGSGYYWSSTPVAGDNARANGLYFFGGNSEMKVTDSKRDDGKSVRAVLVEDPSFKITGKAYASSPRCDVNWVQLWENGPKFAEYNIGATSVTGYGGYYCWGGYKDRDVNQSHAGYGNRYYDAAKYHWGSKWRIPTIDELKGLIENCKCTWIEDYNGTGVNGLLCEGKESFYVSNSIFLPAGGAYEIPKEGVTGTKTYGLYWSYTGYDEGNAWFMRFRSDATQTDHNRCYYGFSVRAVLDE